MTDISPQVLDKLRTFDTPTICNLIELFDVRPRNTGFMNGRIRACFPEMGPVVGFAATASFRSSAPPGKGDAYAGTALQVERFSELSGPPIVVFQDLDDPAVAATFGEMMCATYQAFGAVGLITSGAGRDLDQVRALGFPTFTAGTICAHGYCHILHVHMPVHVGGIAIHPDDLLHGDLNGVTTIPRDVASELANIGDEYVAAESVILDALSGDSPSVKAFREAQSEAYARMGQLRAQVSRAK
jgi:4-hydroxy-4-methyl-2-oxoglutarate aldolase